MIWHPKLAVCKINAKDMLAREAAAAALELWREEADADDRTATWAGPNVGRHVALTFKGEVSLATSRARNAFQWLGKSEGSPAHVHSDVRCRCCSATVCGP